jgi:hypothetical protein
MEKKREKKRKNKKKNEASLENRITHAESPPGEDGRLALEQHTIPS